MDNLIQKFYSNGKEEEQKYTQFGAFSNALLKNSSPNLNFKTTGFIRPNIGTVNPAMHNMETTTNHAPKTPNKTPPTTQELFLHPKKLIFNGTSDLFNTGILKNTLASNHDINSNNMKNTQNNIPSLNTIKQNMNLEAKKNATKMQMMEEKMKNLELKSQRLEVINEFFFDMFENNMVKEELKRQRIKEFQEKDEDKENNDKREDNFEEKNRKKKNRKHKKMNLNIDTPNLQAKNKEELDEIEFKRKTKTFANNFLNNVKNDLGLYLVEEQIKKNEDMQDLIENILDLKGDLVNKLERIQMRQEMEIKKMAYCLQNSGDPVVENLANRIFGNNLIKNSASNTNGQNSYNNTNAKERNSLGPRGSIFAGRNSLFNNLMKSRKQSINSNGNGEEKVPRRQSLFGKENSNEIISRQQSFLDKNEDNRSKRQSLLKSIIPEEKNENEN